MSPHVERDEPARATLVDNQAPEHLATMLKRLRSPLGLRESACRALAALATDGAAGERAAVTFADAGGVVALIDCLQPGAASLQPGSAGAAPAANSFTKGSSPSAVLYPVPCTSSDGGPAAAGGLSESLIAAGLLAASGGAGGGGAGGGGVSRGGGQTDASGTEVSLYDMSHMCTCTCPCS